MKRFSKVCVYTCRRCILLCSKVDHVFWPLTPRWHFSKVCIIIGGTSCSLCSKVDHVFWPLTPRRECWWPPDPPTASSCLATACSRWEHANSQHCTHCTTYIPLGPWHLDMCTCVYNIIVYSLSIAQQPCMLYARRTVHAILYNVHVCTCMYAMQVRVHAIVVLVELCKYIYMWPPFP